MTSSAPIRITLRRRCPRSPRGNGLLADFTLREYRWEAAITASQLPFTNPITISSTIMTGGNTRSYFRFFVRTSRCESVWPIFPFIASALFRSRAVQSQATRSRIRGGRRTKILPREKRAKAKVYGKKHHAVHDKRTQHRQAGL